MAENIYAPLPAFSAFLTPCRKKIAKTEVTTTLIAAPISNSPPKYAPAADKIAATAPITVFDDFIYLPLFLIKKKIFATRYAKQAVDIPSCNNWEISTYQVPTPTVPAPVAFAMSRMSLIDFLESHFGRG
jgi:hypothetical protein